MKNRLFLLFFIIMFAPCVLQAGTISSTNVPLDSPIYEYIEKLASFGLIETEVRGLKPYSKAEVARLVRETEEKLELLPVDQRRFAAFLLKCLHDLVPREISLGVQPEKAPWFDVNPVASMRLRYVYFDGTARDYQREVLDSANQSAFGFIGGNLRPQPHVIVHQKGFEGTPLLENNEGVVYSPYHNGESSISSEIFFTRHVSLLAEARFVATPADDKDVKFNKAYAKIGGGSLEVEVGRDALWFGPGHRGAVTLTNNAKNLDLVKVSSPEPLAAGWVRRNIGLVKYAVVVSELEEFDAGEGLLTPYFIAAKLAIKPTPWFEIGGNFVRQEGGVNNSGEKTTLQDLIFGGGRTDKSNSLAGIDLRFTIPWLRNTELYGEYAGEDSASFWPFVESYVAGIYVPRLSSDGRNDFRFEYFFGNRILYVDHNFPVYGYTYNGLPMGHSQGGAAQDFFVQYRHWFSPRNTMAFQYIRTERGREGRVDDQAIERKDSGRVLWTLPLFGDWDGNLMYGFEEISNFNLMPDATMRNHIGKVEIRFRY